jgi:hypothetical protein
MHHQTKTNKQKNSVALSPRANYTDWATATCQRNLVQTFVDRGVSRGQRGGSPAVVNSLHHQYIKNEIEICNDCNSIYQKYYYLLSDRLAKYVEFRHI